MNDSVRGNRFAVLSMDIEDWYHLDYFQQYPSSQTHSMLDGFPRYLELLGRHGIRTTFFVLSDLVKSDAVLRMQLLEAEKQGHEIACHGKTHTRPLAMTPEDFAQALAQSKEDLSNILGHEVVGYRAPCYSIDNDRYEIMRSTGFVYSSSRMNIPGHPLYGNLDLSDYRQIMQGVLEKDGFVEFSLGTQPLLGRSIAVSGGGWIRLLPWQLMMKPLIQAHLRTSNYYALYIHPFELSTRRMPRVEGVDALTNLRARKGLGKVEERIETLIQMLLQEGYQFCTFDALRRRII